MAGYDWAIKKTIEPGFKESIIDDLKENGREEIKNQIDEYLRRVKELGKELRTLKNDKTKRHDIFD